MKNLKTNLKGKIIRRLTINSEYDPDEELISDFIDEALEEIKKWKNTKDEKIFENGEYDKEIIQYCVESYHTTGIEGQFQNSSNGNSRTYKMTPLQHLQSSIPQGI